MRALILGPLLGALAFILGSAGSASSAYAEDCSDTGVGTLGVPLVEHSCFHTTNGPFASVTAAPGAAPSASTPHVDAVHTHFAVTLPAGTAAVVTYTPVRAGNWAIFTENGIELAVVSSSNLELPVRLTHRVTDCPAIPLVRVYSLAANQRYTLRFGSTGSTATQTPLVIEKVSDFETLHGRDVDGDGFGGRDDTVSTACVPPPGYVRTVSDCRDDDPLVNPGAVELCDGADDNCNGLSDEGACQLGGGGCRSSADGDAGTGAPLALALLLLALAPALGRSKGSRRE